MMDNAGAVDGVVSGGAGLSLKRRLDAYDQLAPEVRRVVQVAPVELRVDHLLGWQDQIGGQALADHLRQEIEAAFPGWSPI